MRLLPLILLTIFTSFSAAGAERTLTPKDVANIRYVASAEISPDGRAIAYTVAVPRKLFEEEDGPAWTELHVWDEAHGVRPFVTGQVNVSGVAWTPDGSAISFLARRGDDKTRSLYVIPLAGGEARRILTHATNIIEYRWLGDGGEVAFRAAEKESEQEREIRAKGFRQEIYEEDVPFTRVWVAHVDGERPSEHELPLEGSANGIAASPDGSQLVVSLAPRPLVDDSYMYTRAYVVDAESGELTYKIDNPGKLGSVHWSPDGDSVAMLAGADEHDPNAGRLYLTNLGTKKTTKYFLDDPGDVVDLAWENDGTILYLWDHGVETSLRELHVGSGTNEPVLEDAYPLMSLAPTARRAALVGSTPQHPAELYLWEAGAGEPKRLTNSNPWLDEVTLAKQEVVDYKARDGLALQGILIRPLDEEPGKRYPLILDIHGGPESHYRHGWMTSYSRLGQVAAAHGFAVFFPNYRASTGRGVKFSMMDHGRPAMEEFDDLVDAVHHLSRQMSLVDEDRAGVTGGSYGGYATAWCSTALSEHFAAGVMFVGISDLISMTLTSDIPDELYLVHVRKRLWDDWNLFLEQSPVYHVQNARTPLLIMDGAADTRVSPSQSFEMYRALKLVGKVPVRLVRYPGEGHGNARAASRYDYTLRALRWFQHFLQDGGKNLPPEEVDYGLPKGTDN